MGGTLAETYGAGESSLSGWVGQSQQTVQQQQQQGRRRSSNGGSQQGVRVQRARSSLLDAALMQGGSMQGGSMPPPVHRSPIENLAQSGNLPSLVIPLPPPLPPLWQPVVIPALPPPLPGSGSSMEGVAFVSLPLPPPNLLGPGHITRLPTAQTSPREFSFPPSRASQSTLQQQHLQPKLIVASPPSSRRSSVPGYATLTSAEVLHQLSPAATSGSSVSQRRGSKDEDVPDSQPSPSSRALLKAHTFDELRLEQLKAQALAESAKARLESLVGSEVDCTRAKVPQLVIGQHHTASGLSVAAGGGAAAAPGAAASSGQAGLPGGQALGALPVLRPASARRASMGPIMGSRAPNGGN